jgi:hypothetical protein
MHGLSIDIKRLNISHRDDASPLVQDSPMNIRVVALGYHPDPEARAAAADIPLSVGTVIPPAGGLRMTHHT